MRCTNDRSSNAGYVLLAALGLGLAGCGSDEPTARLDERRDLLNRAYIVNKDSPELVVIDLSKLEIIAKIPTGGVDNHMADLNADFTKVYVDSSETHETVVVDATKLEVVKRISTGTHPTHLSLSRDGRLLAVMAEDDGAINFIDPEKDEVVKTLRGFYTPHFMRFSADNRHGYVANIGAHHLTRVDMSTLEIDGHIALDGFSGPPNHMLAPNEGGFGDAQIDRNGVLYAAHNATGRVLVYDTLANEKRMDLKVGANPWVAFAEHPFDNVPLKHLVPNFGDQTVSLIDGAGPSVVASLEGDSEAYGVNFSSQAPNKAFVMNRNRQDVSVVDIETGRITARIPVGGNTETAATTADGKWIVAAVSEADSVVVIDAITNEIVKTFENVGDNPWSVTIPMGQNYCH
jgi:DNA-binding beta-propeller fold protein YncE